MAQITRNEIVGYQNQKLKISLFSGTTPVIPSELNFAIFELNSPEKILSPVKMFPLSIDMQPCDIFTLAGAGGAKINDGEYLASFQMPPDASLGRAKIVWYYKTDSMQPYSTFEEEFSTLDYLAVYGSEGKPLVSIEDVRTFLRDFPEYHILIDNYLFKDTEIMAAARNVVGRFNMLPPPVGTYVVGNFPDPGLLLIGIAWWLFDSEANRQLMEQLTYEDGGIHHGVTDKTQLYRAAADRYKADFYTFAQELKTQMNINQICDGTGEGIRFTYNRYYGRTAT